MIPLIRTLVDQGYSERILLSHDAGWYQPGEPNGGQQRPYTALLNTFVPQLLDAGFQKETIRQLTRDNPRNAFAIRQ
jgi:phosphotriesterase-related protein